MAYVNRNAAELKVPGLIVAAGGDPIVDPASNQRFAEAAGIDYRVVPGALHEVFLEQNHFRVQFFEAFDRFLEKNAL
jgi:lysophospholipase